LKAQLGKTEGTIISLRGGIAELTPFAKSEEEKEE